MFPNRHLANLFLTISNKHNLNYYLASTYHTNHNFLSKRTHIYWLDRIRKGDLILATSIEGSLW